MSSVLSSAQRAARVSRYRTLFAAFEVQSQDISLRLPSRRLCIGPHVQECT